MFGLVGGIAGACLLAFLLFLRFRRKEEAAERLASFKGKVALCPALTGGEAQDGSLKACGASLVVVGLWKGKKRQGDLFDCATCGSESYWDMDRAPPLLVTQGRGPTGRRERQRRRREKKRVADAKNH